MEQNTIKKFYRISMGCQYDSYCFKELDNNEYNLIFDIFDECDACGSIEECEFLWVVRVQFEINQKYCKQPNCVELKGHYLLPINVNSLYRKDLFLDLPAIPGCPERVKHLFFKIKEDAITACKEYAEKLHVNYKIWDYTNYSKDLLN